MKIRYILSAPGVGQMTAIYDIRNIEDRELIKMLWHLNNDNVEIQRREFSTGVFTSDGSEVFENDWVTTEDGKTGRVLRKPGGFYLNGKPLGECKIQKIV